MSNLKRVIFLKKAVYSKIRNSAIPTIKKHSYLVIPDLSVTGDQPKEIIRLYEFGNINKANPSRWPLYIAKSAEKWYPNETIIEHLLNRVGECFGFNIAKSKLAIINTQIRFLSKYFLRNDEELIHGADIYAGYVNDREFIESIEEQKLARNFFTLQFTYEAIKSLFPNEVDSIVEGLVKMLLFDALVGNNDRHFYNWAVIRDLKGRRKPVFSPIYDTARGFFWNEDENKVSTVWHDNSRINVYLNKYIKGSKPKVGWDGKQNLNHFQLVELIVEHNWGVNYDCLTKIFTDANLQSCLQMIDNEFYQLLSPERLELTKKCLEMRFLELVKILKTKSV